MEIYTESIKRYTCGPWFVRVWRHEKHPPSIRSDEDIKISIKELELNFATRSEIANALLKLDYVNAVEVKTVNGDGIVLYRDWP